ncbi:LysM domain-containing protein [Chryseobacterium sp.]|uniref:LysM peptidoglycan-binding domain-containing protein n=1 Tax=Chryseobacterium sp. TaxID=1871047 RepID=UPI0028A2B91E|nr:LysM domain-containing protein [Chryseobacterium sp.]
MLKFNKHIIQNGETLDSIAADYNLSAYDLKLFHNNQCEVKDQILIQIRHQKELFVPRIAVEERNKLVKFSRGNRIDFNPKNSFLNYGVVIKIENGENQNELKYDTSVRWMKFEDKLHYFEINRTSNLFINEEEVNEMADLLAYKTSKVLYPLTVSVDEHGKLNDIENIFEYKKRWTAVKDEVYKEYEGEIVDQYCQKIENILNEPDALLIYLKNDYFLRTFFFGIYQKFDQHYQAEIKETFPIINNAIEPNYKIKVEIDPVKDDYDLINISGTGKLFDERSRDDFINRAPFSQFSEGQSQINNDGDFRLVHFLNGETMLAESLYLECDINVEKRKKISVTVAVLD